MKYSIALLILFSLTLQAQAQTTSTTKTPSQKKKTAKPAAPAKDITITIKSLCEKPVPIYAGPKEGLKKPKIQMLGGLSTNTLHLKSSDLVCIMGSDNKRTVACINLKTTTTMVEIGSSGIELRSK